MLKKNECSMKERKRYLFRIHFSSGYMINTYEYEDEIIGTSERLRDGYSSYYNIYHDITDISLVSSCGNDTYQSAFFKTHR